MRLTAVVNVEKWNMKSFTADVDKVSELLVRAISELPPRERAPAVARIIRLLTRCTIEVDEHGTIRIEGDTSFVGV